MWTVLSIVAMLVLFVTLNWLTTALLPPDAAIEIADQAAALVRQPQISAVGDAVDRAVAMLFSLSLGLFVLVGFALKEMPQGARSSTRSILLSGLFLCATIVAIYIAYLSRLQSIYLINRSLAEARDSTEQLITYQAVAVATSATLAVAIAVEWIRRRPRASKSGERQ